jgi:hypothetical protein
MGSTPASRGGREKHDVRETTESQWTQEESTGRGSYEAVKDVEGASTKPVQTGNVVCSNNGPELMTALT